MIKAWIKVGDVVHLVLNNRSLIFAVNRTKAIANSGQVINATTKDNTNLLLTGVDSNIYGSISGNQLRYSISQSDAADNFRSFNISRLLVANFRGNARSGAPITPVINLLLDDD